MDTKDVPPGGRVCWTCHELLRREMSDGSEVKGQLTAKEAETDCETKLCVHKDQAVPGRTVMVSINNPARAVRTSSVELQKVAEEVAM